MRWTQAACSMPNCSMASGHDPLAFFYRERLECLVFEVSDARAFVVIADEAFE